MVLLGFYRVVSGIRDLPWPCDLWTLGRFKMLGLWFVRVGFEVSGVLGFRVLRFRVRLWALIFGIGFGGTLKITTITAAAT